ncbi:MAG: hypothetical protein AAF737_07335 [Pseudomonadota bacterium]
MSFDFTAMGFYALVCGALALIAPSASGWVIRAGFGVIVGLAAAALLPNMRGMIGY